MPLTEDKREFEAVVVGAGPNGFANMVLAADQDSPENLGRLMSAGVCWIEPSLDIGQGTIGNIGRHFRSGRMNTPRSDLAATLFARGQIMQVISGHQSVSAIMQAGESGKPITFEALAAFQEQVAMVGMEHVRRSKGTSRIMFGQRAMQVQRTAEGFYAVSLEDGSEVRGRHIVLANGAKPQPFSLGREDLDAKVIHSSEVLTGDGIEQMKRKVLESGSRRVVVYGSGQSAVMTARFIAEQMGTLLDDIIIAHKRPFPIFQANAGSGEDVCEVLSARNCTRGLRGEESRLLHQANRPQHTIRGGFRGEHQIHLQLGEHKGVKICFYHFEEPLEGTDREDNDFYRGGLKVAAESAAAIVASTGYQAPDLNIVDSTGEDIGPLRTQDGRYIVVGDGGGLYRRDFEPMQRAFGLGLAYGGRTVTPDGSIIGPSVGEISSQLAMPSLRRNFESCREIVRSIFVHAGRTMRTARRALPSWAEKRA